MLSARIWSRPLTLPAHKPGELAAYNWSAYTHYDLPHSSTQSLCRAEHSRYPWHQSCHVGSSIRAGKACGPFMRLVLIGVLEHASFETGKCSMPVAQFHVWLDGSDCMRADQHALRLALVFENDMPIASAALATGLKDLVRPLIVLPSGLVINRETLQRWLSYARWQMLLTSWNLFQSSHDNDSIRDGKNEFTAYVHLLRPIHSGPRACPENQRLHITRKSSGLCEKLVWSGDDQNSNQWTCGQTCASRLMSPGPLCKWREGLKSEHIAESATPSGKRLCGDEDI